MTQPKEISWWQNFWPKIKEDSELLREVIEDVRNEDGAMPIYTLNEDDAADFYIYLRKLYELQDQELIWTPFSSWLSSFLDRLIWRRTPAAISSLYNILSEFPNLYQAKRGIQDIKHSLRYIWESPSPDHLLKMLQDAKARLIDSPEQLLSLTMKLLEELQEKRFNGQTPIRFALWNTIKETSFWRPVDEEDLSNLVAHLLRAELEERGVIVNREVQITRGYDKKGEDTDIHVIASSKNKRSTVETITVIIEVKGSFHREVKTAMETQLLNRYMQTDRKACGLYLVGWFNCATWFKDRDDSRHAKSITKKDTIITLSDLLNQQALELSQHGRTINSFVLDLAFDKTAKETKTD
jgi:hypothetical protein